MVADGDFEAFKKERPEFDLAIRVADRGNVEFLSNFEMQSYGVRRYACNAVSRLLDVGCGLAIGPDYAQQMLGATALGVDPSESAASSSRLLGVPLVNDYFTPGAAALERSYDVIQAWELVEHLEDPAAMLGDFRDLMAEGGMLCLSTPAAEAIEPGASPETILRVLAPPEHFHLFSAQSLNALLKDCGFAQVEIERHGDHLIAVAGAALPPKRSDAQARELYRAYLKRGALRLEPDNPFKHGFVARLLQLALATGDWVELDAMLRACEDHYERAWAFQPADTQGAWRGLIEGPVQAARLESLPFSLTLYLFANARSAQVKRDWQRARRFFEAARQCGLYTTASLALLGLGNAEIPFLAEKAERFLKDLPE